MADELGLFGDEGQPLGTDEKPAPLPAAPEPAPAPAPVAEPAPETAKPAEEPKGEPKDASPASTQPRDEHGKFKPREPGDEPQVPLSALLEERKRRQTAEEATKAAAKAPPPDIWTNPDEYFQAKLAEKTPEILAQAEVKAREQFFRYTENSATTRHATDSVKYEQARDAFIEAAQKNPIMQNQLREAVDPGEYIYQQGRIALELKEVGGDLAAYRKRIEDQVRQQIATEAEARKAKVAAIPVSLNSEPSKGAGVTGPTAWAGPTSVEELFPER